MYDLEYPRTTVSNEVVFERCHLTAKAEAVEIIAGILRAAIGLQAGAREHARR